MKSKHKRCDTCDQSVTVKEWKSHQKNHALQAYTVSFNAIKEDLLQAQNQSSSSSSNLRTFTISEDQNYEEYDNYDLYIDSVIEESTDVIMEEVFSVEEEGDQVIDSDQDGNHGNQETFIAESNLLETLIGYIRTIETPLYIKLQSNSDPLTLQEQSSLGFNKLLKDKNITNNAREGIIKWLNDYFNNTGHGTYSAIE
jgi:hypothetical protein